MAKSEAGFKKNGNGALEYHAIGAFDRTATSFLHVNSERHCNDSLQSAFPGDNDGTLGWKRFIVD